MELIFVVAVAAIVWLYFVNAVVCYVVVGGGISAIVTAVLLSKTLKARKLIVSEKPVTNLEAGVRIGSLHPEPKGLVVS